MGKARRERMRVKRGSWQTSIHPQAATEQDTQQHSIRSHNQHKRVRPFFTSTQNSTVPSSANNSSSNPFHVDLLRLAFIEWLLHCPVNDDRHVLWESFLTDWSCVPEYELPVSVNRPFNLHALIKSYRSPANVAAARKEIRQGRQQLAQGEGGLKSHQSLLQYYLEEQEQQPTDIDTEHRAHRSTKRRKISEPASEQDTAAAAVAPSLSNAFDLLSEVT